TRARLENGLGELDAKQVVLERFQAAKVRREYVERALDRRLDRDLCPHGCLLRLGGHGISFVGCLNGRSVVSTAGLAGRPGFGPEPFECAPRSSNGSSLRHGGASVRPRPRSPSRRPGIRCASWGNAASIRARAWPWRLRRRATGCPSQPPPRRRTDAPARPG